MVGIYSPIQSQGGRLTAKNPLFLRQQVEKLVVPLIAVPNVDEANRRTEERQKAELAQCVICMQKGIVDYIFAS
jgi:hypothetical protein